MPLHRSTRFSSTHFSVFRTVPCLSLNVFVRQFGCSCQYTPFIFYLQLLVSQWIACQAVGLMVVCGGGGGGDVCVCVCVVLELQRNEHEAALRHSKDRRTSSQPMWVTVLEYSGRSAFKSRLRHQLSGGISWFFSVLPAKCLYTFLLWAVVA